MDGPGVPRICQIAMCTADMARSVRRYVEGLGFSDAGAHTFSGQRIAAIQQLGDDTTGLIWWLVGRQEMVQLELFHHSDPPFRALPDDWRPSDLGWVRWGVTVPDLNGTISRLRSLDTPVAEPRFVRGKPWTCFRDPDIGVVVELWQDVEVHPQAGPRVTDVGLSVPDLDAAEAFYVEALGLTRTEEIAHAQDRDRMWGLPETERAAFGVQAGEILLEIVEYISPKGRPRPDDARLSDQGIMNIALGYDDRAELEAAITHAEAAGASVNYPLREHVAVAATYLTDPQGFSIEMLNFPWGREADFGFVARRSFPPSTAHSDPEPA